MATAKLDIGRLDDDEQIQRHRRGDPWRSKKRANTADRALRFGTAALLLVISVVHLHLWLGGYRYLPTIGPLFLLDVVVAALLAVVVAVRSNVVGALGAGLLAAGTLGANILSLLLPKGLFRFMEIGVSYSGGFAITSEVGVVVLVATWAYLHWKRGDLVAPRRPAAPNHTSAAEPTFPLAPAAPSRAPSTSQSDVSRLRASNQNHGSHRASAKAELTQRKERT